jgi:hypothetical protein
MLLMARAEYPKSRRMIMQGAMCLIFGATVALAGFVTHLQRSAGNSRLSGIIYVGNVGVRLPKGWDVQPKGAKDTGLILLVATEPDSAGKKGRKITIRKHQLDTLISSEEFLGTGGLLRGTDPFSTDPDENAAEPIMIAGYSGVMVCAKRPIGGIPFLRASEERTVWFAASVRPSLLAISLELDRPDDSAPRADPMLLEDIAAAMEMQDSGK